MSKKAAKHGEENGVIDIVDNDGERGIQHPGHIVPAVLIHNSLLIGNGIGTRAAAPAAVAGGHDGGAVVAAEHVVGAMSAA